MSTHKESFIIENFNFAPKVKILTVLLIFGTVSVFAMALPVKSPCKNNSAIVLAQNRLAPPKNTKPVPSTPVPSPPTQLPWGMFGNNSQNAPAPPNSPTNSAIDYNKPFDGRMYTLIELK